MPEPALDGRLPTPTAMPADQQSAVLVTFRGRVPPDWVDTNGHMNVSFYDRVFDAAEHALFAAFGVQDEFIRRTGFSVFRLDKLIRYERELMEGDAIAVHSRVLWTDFRRVQAFHELVNADASYRAATSDALSIHVDLAQRKSALITLPEVRAPLERLVAAQAMLPVPVGAVARDGAWRARG
jgi:acyl-CoA thioester hydrolase